MPIVDFVRVSKPNRERGEEAELVNGPPKHSIEIAPYHTGHLGFIPTTQVTMNLHRSVGNGINGDGCELVVTPFHRPIGGMFRLMCLLKDRPGVVNRLLTALARLDLNVVKEDSVILNADNHHFVELILDWSRNPEMKSRRQARSSDINRYRHMQERMPISDYRYMRLYEVIMTYCGDIIEVDKSYGQRLPAIHVRPFTHRRSEHTSQGVIESDPSKQKRGPSAILRLSEQHLTKIAGHNGFELHEDIPYLVSSQGEARTLRVFFPAKEQHSRMLSVGLEHDDHAGAIALYSDILADMRFNIIASLLRKKSEQRSTWELVLEAPEDKKVPADQNATIIWFAEEHQNASKETLGKISEYNFFVTAPAYPKHRFNKIPIVSEPASKSDYRKESLHSIMEETLQRCKQKEKQQHRAIHQSHFCENILERIDRKRPRIFLSYSENAKGHASLLKGRKDLEVNFKLVEYQEADFANITIRAIDKIHECDFFIGVWHHELIPGSREYTVSPWMPFEYGAALAAGKPAIIVHSEFLPKSITRRINSGIAHPQYSDLTFKEITVDAIVSHCLEDWLKKDQYIEDKYD